jgi:hypothetical protein
MSGSPSYMDRKKITLEKITYEAYAETAEKKGFIIPYNRQDTEYCRLVSTLEFSTTDALFAGIEEDLSLLRFIRIVGHESITMAKLRFNEDPKKSWELSKKLAFYRPLIDVEYEGAGMSRHEALYFRISSGAVICGRIFLGPYNLRNYSLASQDLHNKFYVHGIF